MTRDDRSPPSLPAFAVMTLLLAVACTSSGGSGPSPTTPSGRTQSVALPTAATTASPLPSGALRVAGHVVGGRAHPGYWVTIPATGWSSGDGGFILMTGGPVVGMSVWDVGQVAGDPCHWRSTLADSGHSVSDLVDKLVAQKTRNATAPKSVTLDGHPGQYLEWSVPIDAVVTGDSDFAGCDLQEDHRDFVSWMGKLGGERYQQVAGQVDQLWVLDVDDERLVIDASYAPDASAAARDELGRIVESLRFERP